MTRTKKVQGQVAGRSCSFRFQSFQGSELKAVPKDVLCPNRKENMLLVDS